MVAASARITAVGHTDTRAPRVTSPITAASGWMKTLGSILMETLPDREMIQRATPRRAYREAAAALWPEWFTTGAATPTRRRYGTSYGTARLIPSSAPTDAIQ